MKKYILIAIAIFATGPLLQSCDPTYSISVSNQTSDQISVIAYTNASFHADETVQIHPRPDDPDWVAFNINPGSTVQCGMAIGGLWDDLPFTQLIIYTPQDTITAKNTNEVFALFDWDSSGDLKIPYQITIAKAAP